MAHKTLINGTAYEISGGRTLVNGTGYSIDKGKTLVGGTAYEVGFGGVSSDGKILDDWATIKSQKNIGLYSIGNYKPITLTTGEIVNMEIAAFNTDIASDGSTASITWIAKDILNTERAMYSDSKAEINWPSTEVRTFLQGEFFNALPNSVKQAIVTVRKTYYDCYTNDTFTCEDNIWIPSRREVLGYDSGETYVETSGVIYSDYFSNKESRIRGGRWWLRTTKYVGNDISNYFQVIQTNGAISSMGQSVTMIVGVLPCFCT